MDAIVRLFLRLGALFAPQPALRPVPVRARILWPRTPR